MRILAALAALVLLAGCVTPAPVVVVDPAVFTELRVLAAPEPYASAGLALEQRGRVTYRWVDQATANRICNGSGACTYRRLTNACVITISTSYSGQFLEDMKAHERAHCAGWPASHPL